MASKQVLYKDFTKVKWGVSRRNKKNGHPNYPDPTKFRFTEIAPLATKNYVAGKGVGETKSACIPEMMSLFTCLAENEYHQKHCPEQVATFQKCYGTYQATNKIKRAEKQSAEPVPYANVLRNDQLNTLMKRHPQKHDPKLFTKTREELQEIRNKNKWTHWD